MNKVLTSKPFVVLLIMALLILTMAPVWASGDRDTSSAEANADADAIATASAIATGGVSDAVVNSSTRAYSVSGSDMAIRDCLATHAVLFGLWQGTHINALCEAAGMNADGKYEAAAKMKCSIKHFRKVYGKGQKCIDAVILSDPPMVSMEPVIIEEDDDDDDDEDLRYLMLLERMDQMDAERSKMNRARAANVRRYEREQAEQKQADEDFYGAYIEKFEVMQQTEKHDICCTTEEQPDNE